MTPNDPSSPPKPGPGILGLLELPPEERARHRQVRELMENALESGLREWDDYNRDLPQ
jgi:hypothetical protein